MPSQSSSRATFSFEPWADLRLLYEANPSGSGSVVIACDLPGHQDDSPSFHIWHDHTYCFGCRTWEGRFQHCRRRGLWPHRLEGGAPLNHLVVQSSYQTARGPDARALSGEELSDLTDFYQKKLWDLGKEVWLKDRGLKEETIRLARLGHSGRAYVIPVLLGSQIQSLRFRRDDALSSLGGKYWGLAGQNQTHLYAPVPLDSRVILTEGEFDCLIAIQCGYSGCTFTNGIGSFDPEPFWDHFARVQEVVLATDQDGPGLTGAIRLGKALRQRGIRVRYPLWREKDLTNLYLSRGETGIHQVLGGH